MSHTKIKTIAGAAARLFHKVEDRSLFTGFGRYAKKKLIKPTDWFMYPSIRPYDRTGFFKTEEEQIRRQMLFDLRKTGRGPPKKGQGKKAQLAAKAAAAAEKKAKKK